MAKIAMIPGQTCFYRPFSFIHSFHSLRSLSLLFVLGISTTIGLVLVGYRGLTSCIQNGLDWSCVLAAVFRTGSAIQSSMAGHEGVGVIICLLIQNLLSKHQFFCRDQCLSVDVGEATFVCILQLTRVVGAHLVE